MTTENQGYIIDVIADLQKRLASETASNKYLRGELETKKNEFNVLVEDYNKKNLLIAELEAKITTSGDVIDYQNSQIAEQKETIETLQSTIKSMDMEYGKLVEKYNALNPAKNGTK
jgi:chromosome segregation ATPase